MSEVKEVKENFSIKKCWFLCTDKEHCSACSYKNCEEIENCYFKQLQTAQEENKELKEKLFNRGTSPLHSAIVEKLEQENKKLKEEIKFLTEYKRKSITCQECYDEGLEIGKRQALS